MSDQVEIYSQAETINCTSWVVHHYPRTNPAWLTAALLKIAMTL